MNQVVIGLGSNVGDRRRNLRVALRRLERKGGAMTILSRSRAYVSDAMLPPDAPDDGGWNLPFYNMAVLVETPMPPERLLAELKSIEIEMGREARARWAPRIIDLDLLIWSGLSIETRDLTLPHPGLTERPFALLPTAELVPHWRYLGLGRHSNRTIAEIAKEQATERQALKAEALNDGFPAIPELMGILNVTPDSFSDGGMYQSPGKAIQRIRECRDSGASIIDIGAESTRPGARPIDSESEISRLAPLMEALVGLDELDDLVLSIDTRHAATAGWILGHELTSRRRGSLWINDVGGFADPAMRETVAGHRADLVVMHSLGVPADRDKVMPEDCDPVELLLQWWRIKEEEFRSAGISRDRLIFDPGIGFGKTPLQSLEILRRMSDFRVLGVRTLVGHSRKSFLGLFTDQGFAERDTETLAASLCLADRGVDYLRIHDVASHTRALKVHHALRFQIS